MTKLIQQRSFNDCAIPCIAMALGVTYDELAIQLPVEMLAGIHESGTKTETMIEMFGLMGLEVENFRHFYYGPSWGTVKWTKNLLWGRRSILSCHSLNHKDGKHYVYFNCEKLFDPSTRKTYKSFDDMEPIEIWLFKE